MVNTHTHFKTIISEGWFWIRRSVYSCVTDKMVQRACRLECLQVGNKIANTFKTSEFELHNDIGTVEESILLGDCSEEGNGQKTEDSCKQQ